MRIYIQDNLHVKETVSYRKRATYYGLETIFPARYYSGSEIISMVRKQNLLFGDKLYWGLIGPNFLMNFT